MRPSCWMVPLLPLLHVCPAGAADPQGSVLNAAGRPVPRARVQAYLCDDEDSAAKPLIRSVVADTRGRFPLDRLKAAGTYSEHTHYHLLATAPGFAPGGTLWEAYDPQKRGQPVRISLAPAASWRAVVVDSKGKPVAGCPVRIESVTLNFTGKPLPKDISRLPESEPGKRPTFEQVNTGDPFQGPAPRTNARGEVVFASAPRDGAVRVSIAHGDYARLSTLDLRVDAAKPARLVLRLGGRIAGRVVVASTGAPRAGLRVAASRGYESGSEGVTDAQGKFRLDHLLPGTYDIVIHFPRSYDLTAAPIRKVTMRAGQTTAHQEFQLVEGSVVSGRVTDAAGKPAKDVMVWARERMSTLSDGLTDAEGRYRLRLPPGRRFLECYAMAGGASKWIGVKEGASLEVDLTLSSADRLGGAGAPPVVLRPGDYPMQWVVAQEDEDEEGPDFLGTGRSSLTLLAARPREARSVPPLAKGDRRKYGSISLGDPQRPYVVILDERKGRTVAVYADTDGDGDLAHERRFTPSDTRDLMPFYRWVRFPTITLKCLYGEQTRPMPVRPEEDRRKKPSYHSVTYQIAGYWQGEVDTDRGKMSVCLLSPEDRGHKALSVRGSGGSTLWLDLALSGGGAFQWGEGSIQQLAEAQMVSGRLYRFTPSATGDRLAVEEYAGPAGTLEVAATGGRGQPARLASFTLSGSAGSFSVSGSKTALPPGIYQTYHARIFCEDGKARYSLTIRPTKPINVTAGETARLALGGPLSLRLQGVTVARPAGKRKAGKATKPLPVPPPTPAAQAAPRPPASAILLTRGNVTKVKIEMADAQGAGVQPDAGGQASKVLRGVLKDAAGKPVAKMTFEFG